MLERKFHLYNLHDKGGWLLSPTYDDKFNSNFIQFGRTNFLDPWSDPAIHYHTTSQELYLVMHGELWLKVGDSSVVLKERNLLLVQPGIPHAVVGGKGSIQHFGLKIPCISDEKIVVREVTQYEKNSKPLFIDSKDLDPKEGFIADFTQDDYRNCWVFGFGIAKYLTDEFSLAYMVFKDENEDTSLENYNDYHLHNSSEEWYFTFKGSQEILVNDENVVVSEGNLLRIGSGIPHKINKRQYPFEGMVLRAPLTRDDKVVVNLDL
ncbi:MAG: cupin domain-containing protein [Asgard group archaeon]|nr:cupin domain-containing protein [Asgard group archaeon]